MIIFNYYIEAVSQIRLKNVFVTISTNYVAGGGDLNLLIS